MKRLGVVFAITGLALAWPGLIQAEPDAAPKECELFRLRAENARLREISNSSLQELQARTNELALCRQLIAAIKSTNEALETLLGRSLSDVGELTRHKVAFATYAEQTAKTAAQDALIYEKWAKTKTGPGSPFGSVRWRLRQSLTERSNQMKELNRVIFMEQMEQNEDIKPGIVIPDPLPPPPKLLLTPPTRKT